MAQEEKSPAGQGARKERKRAFAPRVRTGCITCRYSAYWENRHSRRLTYTIRKLHVKCDEAKPTCVNCASRRRLCEGYQSATSLRRFRAAITPQPNPETTPFPAIPGPRERELFFLFRNIIIKEQKIFKSHFRDYVTLQACQQYPAVWHIGLAVAAVIRNGVQQRANANQSLPSPYEIDDDSYAKLNCNKAMRYLIELQGQTLSFRDQEMVLITCIFLSAYYNFRRQPSETLMHAKGGLRLIQQWGCWQRAAEMRKDACPPNCIAPLPSIFAPFLRLEQQIYGCPVMVPAMNIVARPPNAMYLSREPLQSVEEAYEGIMFIIMSYGSFIDIDAPAPNPEESLQDCAKSRYETFTDWRRRFDEFRRRYIAGKDYENCVFKKDYTLLDIQLMVIRLYELSVITSLELDASKGSLSWDDHTDRLKDVVDLAEGILERIPRVWPHPPPADSWMAAVPMLSEPLQVIGLASRDAELQQRVVRIMKEFPHRSGYFGSRFIAELIDTKARAERAGSQEAPIEGGCKCEPGTFICSDHRIIGICAVDSDEESGYVTMIMNTGYSERNGLPGRRYRVPCFEEEGIGKFR